VNNQKKEYTIRNRQTREKGIYMSRKTAILLLIIIILGVVAALSVYDYETNVKTRNMVENHAVLILIVNPSETRPGPGAVDTALVVVVRNGTMVNMTTLYPRVMAHPKESAPADIAAISGDNKLYLHDTLWWSDIDKDVKLAQETVEYNTNITTESVVIIKPEAVDALINVTGPIYVPGQGNVNISSTNFLGEEQTNGNLSKSDAIESLVNSIKNASYSEEKRSKAFSVLSEQYSKGNIIVTNLEIFYEFLSS
jgi:hypothetical protein